MIKKILNKLFSGKTSLDNLEVLALRAENEMLKEKIGDPRFVAEKVLDRGIKWFNAQEMPTTERRRYYSEAQQILTSTAFNNVVNFLIATQCQEQVKQYNPNLNTNPIRDVQMMINGLELLREELDSINDPDKEPTIKLPGEEYDPYALT